MIRYSNLVEKRRYCFFEYKSNRRMISSFYRMKSGLIVDSHPIHTRYNVYRFNEERINVPREKKIVKTI